MIGHPVAHSRSPAIHNAAFRTLDLDWVFVALDVAEVDVARAVEGVRALGIAGLSVTMPHKSVVAAHLDRLSADAAALGAVNCVYRDGSELVGDNTDGPGFMGSLAAETGFDPSGRSCAVIGAGGAARAVVLALTRAGASDVAVVNRTRDRGEAAAELAGRIGHTAGPEAVTAADLVVNATPIGMGAAAAEMPLDPDLLHTGQVLVDLVYEPATTAVVRAARERGVTALNGLGMLVGQAAVAFERWTGVAAPVEVMARTVGSRLG